MHGQPHNIFTVNRVDSKKKKVFLVGMSFNVHHKGDFKIKKKTKLQL